MSSLRQQLPPLVLVDGTAIRAARERAGLSVTQLAAACGSSAGYIGHIEGGRRNRLSGPRFSALAAALRVKPQELLMPDAA